MALYVHGPLLLFLAPWSPPPLRVAPARCPPPRALLWKEILPFFRRPAPPQAEEAAAAAEQPEARHESGHPATE